jgi:glycosyltransferase involved in cell wall biosynthesis
MTNVRFSVVITCYNQSDFIGQAVESALSQTYSAEEVIVVDDGSTDRSMEVLGHYLKSIRLVRFPTNQGAIAARNVGAAKATGDYLVFLDGDDVLKNWALSVYSKIITERSPKIIAARSTWFDGASPDYDREEVPSKIQFVEYENFVEKDRSYGYSASTWVVERRTFTDAGGWTPEIFHLDLVDLATKLGCSGRAVLVSAPCTVFYRVHAGNSIHVVPPFLDMMHYIMRKERGGEYAGGKKYRFQRRAWLGGNVFFWTKRAIKARHYKQALKLVASGWSMILAAVLRRANARITGRRPIETLGLGTDSFSNQRHEGAGVEANIQV